MISPSKKQGSKSSNKTANNLRKIMNRKKPRLMLRSSKNKRRQASNKWIMKKAK
jgi:hypothetical protein